MSERSNRGRRQRPGLAASSTRHRPARPHQPPRLDRAAARPRRRRQRPAAGSPARAAAAAAAAACRQLRGAGLALNHDGLIIVLWLLDVVRRRGGCGMGGRRRARPHAVPHAPALQVELDRAATGEQRTPNSGWRQGLRRPGHAGVPGSCRGARQAAVQQRRHEGTWSAAGRASATPVPCLFTSPP